MVSSHRWLGPQWPSDLDFRAVLCTQLQRTSTMVAQLASLSSLGAVPWLEVVELFHAKVDALFDFGRWLFVLVPGAEVLIDDAYCSWARILLGGNAWRNYAPCSSELGWTMSGFDRVVQVVAMRRARLWQRGGGDWHATFMRMAASVKGSWSHTSLAILQQKGIPDWPEEPYGSYADTVTKRLSTAYCRKWRVDVARHRAQVPYYLLVESPGEIFRTLQSWNLSAEMQHNLRSWCRLRCGLLCLRHVEGHRSMARYQRCIFCNQRVRNATVHAISTCGHWSLFRGNFAEQAALVAEDGRQQFTLEMLKVGRSLGALEVALRWAAEMDAEERRFWCEG